MKLSRFNRRRKTSYTKALLLFLLLILLIYLYKNADFLMEYLMGN